MWPCSRCLDPKHKVLRVHSACEALHGRAGIRAAPSLCQPRSEVEPALTSKYTISRVSRKEVHRRGQSHLISAAARPLLRVAQPTRDDSDRSARRPSTPTDVPLHLRSARALLLRRIDSNRSGLGLSLIPYSTRPSRQSESRLVATRGVGSSTITRLHAARIGRSCGSVGRLNRAL